LNNVFYYTLEELHQTFGTAKVAESMGGIFYNKSTNYRAS